MNVIELINGWSTGEPDSTVSLPCRLPISDDTLTTVVNGIKGNAILDVDGANADVFVSGQFAGSTFGRTLIDVSSYVKRNTEIKLVLEERGGVLSRNVKLHTADSDAYILPYGVSVTTVEMMENGGAMLSVSVDVRNLRNEKRRLGIRLDVLSERGKKISNKTKYYAFFGGDRTVTMKIKMRKAIPYLSTAPKLYNMSVSLVEEGEKIDVASTKFGVCTYGSYSVTDKLVGAVVPHSSGVLGKLSYADGERRKLYALSDLGYNTVRYIGCPSDNALAVTDELGLRVIVDLFDNWAWPRKGGTHKQFATDYISMVATAVRTLRNHPSVIMYSLGNKLEESYGRAGASKQEDIISIIKAMDNSRPITCALAELTPLASELKDEGFTDARVKEATTEEELKVLGREVALYRKRTTDFASRLDLYGYSGYSSNYPHVNKPIIGLATEPTNYYRAINDMIRSADILGDLSDCGMDNVDGGFLALGDVDSTCLPRPIGIYRSILLGGNATCITTGEGTPFGEMHWNYSEGDRVTVRVITGGDVVGLYLNGRLIGRKLAGKINSYIATFNSVAYEDGTLEAVCFSRGREIGRATLQTTTKAKQIKILSSARTVKASAGELAFYDVWVLDKEGRIVPTSHELTFETVGGSIVALGDGYGESDYGDTVTATNGHALVVVKPDGSERVTLKASGVGLLRGQLTLKVK
ncbi:MAG: DUF4982 domain-containing protein [Clostridia bacterium]|nr:DUF4982 domain-containing protein [Clostridia bacterium]